MGKIKFENIDLFNESIIEGDKIMGGYGDTAVLTYTTTANPAPEHADPPFTEYCQWC